MISLFINIYIILSEKCTIKQNYGFGNCLSSPTGIAFAQIFLP